MWSSKNLPIFPQLLKLRNWKKPFLLLNHVSQPSQKIISRYYYQITDTFPQFLDWTWQRKGSILLNWTPVNFLNKFFFFAFLSARIFFCSFALHEIYFGIPSPTPITFLMVRPWQYQLQCKPFVTVIQNGGGDLTRKRRVAPYIVSSFIYCLQFRYLVIIYFIAKLTSKSHCVQHNKGGKELE